MKIYGVLIKSDNALTAEEENRFPMTEAKKRLRFQLRQKGIKSTLYGCERLLRKHGDDGEWHHVSKFANEIGYYDVQSVFEHYEECLDHENDKGVRHFLEMAKSRKKKQVSKAIKRHVQIEYRVFDKKRRCTTLHYNGPAIVKGDWIWFDGIRKKLSGNHINVKYR